MSFVSAPQHIALGQFNARLGDLRQNCDKLLSLVRQAHHQGAMVLALPYGAITGTPLYDLAHLSHFRHRVLAHLEGVAQQLLEEDLTKFAIITATEIGGLSEVLVISGGEVHSHPVADNIATIKLPNNQVLPTVVATSVVDIESLGPFTKAGPDFPSATPVLVLGAVPFERHGLERVEKALAHLAATTGSAVQYVNMVGGQDALVYAGGSIAVTNSGEVLHRSPAFEEDVATPTAKNASIAVEESSAGQVYRALTLGLRDYVEKNGFSSVVLGLSGGIDSALLAAVAADAIGGDRVTCVAMPSPYSSQHSLDDAKDLAQRIGADYRVIPIQAAMDAFTATLPMPGLAEENLQARIRGVLLMAISNTEGKLVLAPGNKSEIAVGYSTIYGDAVGGYAPLKDVYKSEVWALSRWRNNLALDQERIPPIPESSITKPPSAELRFDQVDQDSLPQYDILDALLRSRIEERMDRQELIANGFEAETVDRILKLLAVSEWKRAQYPIGPKVTSRAFNTDRRVPITNRWRDHEGDNV